MGALVPGQPPCCSLMAHTCSFSGNKQGSGIAKYSIEPDLPTRADMLLLTTQFRYGRLLFSTSVARKKDSHFGAKSTRFVIPSGMSGRASAGTDLRSILSRGRAGCRSGTPAQTISPEGLARWPGRCRRLSAFNPNVFHGLDLYPEDQIGTASQRRARSCKASS